MTVSTELKTEVRNAMLTHEYQKIEVIMKKLGWTRDATSRVLRALIADAWVIWQKKGRIVSYKLLKSRAAIAMPPIRKVSGYTGTPPRAEQRQQ